MKNEILQTMGNSVNYALANPEYVDSVVIAGPITILNTNNGNSMYISSNACTALAESNFQQQEVYELLAYLKDRFEMYISTFDVTPVSPKKAMEENLPLEVMSFGENYFVPLFTSLMEKYGYDMIVAALDAVSDQQLFGILDKDRYADYETIVDEKVRYITALIDVHTLYADGNIDELNSKYNKGLI